MGAVERAVEESREKSYRGESLEWRVEWSHGVSRGAVARGGSRTAIHRGAMELFFFFFTSITHTHLFGMMRPWSEDLEA